MTQTTPRLLCTGLLAMLLVWPAAAAPPVKPPGDIRIGILAVRPKAEVHEAWQPTVDYLSRSIPGYRFKMLPLSVVELRQAVAAGRLDFVVTNPENYVVLEVEHGVTRIATLINRAGSQQVKEFGGVIILRADNTRIHGLADLKRKRVASVDTTAFGGYLMQAAELARAGIDSKDDIRLQLTGYPQDRVVYAVRDGLAEAGFVRTGVLESMVQEGKISLDQFRVLNPQPHDDFPFLVSTRLYPEWSFSAAPDIPEALANKVAIALLSMPHDGAVARHGNYYGWAVPLSYEPVLEVMKIMRVAPYDTVQHFTPADVLRKYAQPIMLLLALVAGGLLWLSLRATRLNRSLRGQMNLVSERTAELERLKFALDQHAIVSITDTDGIITYANDRFCAVSGLSAEELIGADHRVVKSDVHPPAFFAQMWAVISGGNVWQGEICNRSKSGALYWLQSTIVPIPGRHGLPREYIAIRTDITEVKKVDQMKNEFIATVSHELRTPLTSIRGAVGLVSAGATGDIPDKARTLLDIAYQNSGRLTQIINDILDIEKIESGKMQYEIRAYPLNALLAQAIDANQSYAEHLQVRLVTAGEVPTVSISTDSQRFMQVMANLLSNAAKFSPAGGVVEISASADRGRARVTVVDHGAGIPEEFHARVFNKFSQADASNTRARGGSGLGLSISRAIIEQLGGEIGFEPTSGGGTTFYFDLPLAAAPADVQYT